MKGKKVSGKVASIPWRRRWINRRFWSSQTLLLEVADAFPLTIYWEFLLSFPQEFHRTSEWRAISNLSKGTHKAIVFPICMKEVSKLCPLRTQLLVGPSSPLFLLPVSHLDESKKKKVCIRKGYKNLYEKLKKKKKDRDQEI